MEVFQTIVAQPFTWGLVIGLGLFLWACLGHARTHREFKRYRQHLTDKLELESRAMETNRKELESLRKENEHLRVKVNQLKEKPGHTQQRDLEIMARAEQQMMVAAPGFAGAWEQAKMRAREELEAEESGKSLPRRLFRQLMGTTARTEATAEEAEAEAGAGKDGK